MNPDTVMSDHTRDAQPSDRVPVWNNASWNGTSWRRPDDELAAAELNHPEIRRYAIGALRAADAVRVVPTPLEAVREALNLTSVEQLEVLAQDLPPGLRARMRRVLRKLRGFAAIGERIVWVDNGLRHTQSRFVLGHEIGHHVLPWQRDATDPTYRLDTDDTLTPTVRDRFEREANAFAAELLFNVDELKVRAIGAPLSLSTPVELQQQFDASLISTTRRYVETHDASVALLLLGQYPTVSMGRPGTRIMFGVQSAKFARQFGAVVPGLRLAPAWPRDLHDLADHCYSAVAGRHDLHTRGRYRSHIDVEFNYEVFAARPFPFVLLTPARRLLRPTRTRIAFREP